MGTEATRWQMFQQISLYNKKLGQNCRKGCFLKKHTDFKETSGGICKSTERCQPRGRVCRHAVGRVRRWWELAARDWNNIWAAASWPGQFERAPVVPQTLISQSWGGGGGRGDDTGCAQELMCFGSRVFSSVTAEGHTQLQNWTDTPGQSCSVHRAVSVGLGQDPSRQLLQRVWNKEYPDKAVKTPHTLSWQGIPKGCIAISI